MTVDQGAVDEDNALLRRVAAVEGFTQLARRMIAVEDMEWSDAAADYRLLAINSSLRRQLEAIDAACLLSRTGLGHLAVAFVRSSIEDVMYLEFFMSLAHEEAQELFALLANWDALRSLLAQRDYLGDEEMRSLWYSTEFLNHAVEAREQVHLRLKTLQQHHKWDGGLLPNAKWIADRAGRQELYDYLHAATSRALHFSAGEILRRSWGHPEGIITTAKPEFRAHLAAFALDQLWHLYVETWGVALPVFEKAGLGGDASLDLDDLRPAIDKLLSMGRIPLVHAHEWNLTPDGPLDLS